MTTVNVTTQHIRDGERESTWGCAVALALQDAFPAATEISVGLTDFEMVDRHHLTGVQLPLEAQEFIAAFDIDSPVEPFSFELDYPAEAA